MMNASGTNIARAPETKLAQHAAVLRMVAYAERRVGLVRPVGRADCDALVYLPLRRQHRSADTRSRSALKRLLK